MRFLIFSLVFLMFSMMFAKTSLLFCCFCIRFFQTSMLLLVSVCCYAKARCYYWCPYAVLRKLDAIIRVRMLLCESSMLLFVSVCCYAKPRCYYSCPYAVMQNLDAIIRVSNSIEAFCLRMLRGALSMRKTAGMRRAENREKSVLG